jgi:monooxygenase
MAEEDLDVLIVGAGLSGIDAAYRLQERNPALRYAVLEGRDAIGGTWDLFRYPGIRSDSDMVTLGFPFRPWRQPRSIVSGEAIRDYIRETAALFGIDKRIRFRHRVTAAAFSSDEARWTVEVEADGARRTIRCNFLYLCCGYYDYAAGHAPEWPGMEEFGGQIVHPQFWPEELDVSNKRVVVIGSGATAVTLVPALADKAAHITMLQRSPSYVVAMPAHDTKAAALRRWLPRPAADVAVKWKNVAYSIVTYNYARKRPDRMRKLIRAGVLKELGHSYEVDRHFNPRYDPWDQRLCLTPDGDLFEAIRGKRATIVTDTIERFTATGLRLQSGEDLPADIVVTATGLVVKLMGGMQLSVDGEPIAQAGRMIYRGAMLEGVPNMAFAFGYTNASWTLKCDLSARFVSGLLARMRREGEAVVTPTPSDPAIAREPMLAFNSGYVERAAAIMPVQGARPPWRVHQNYALDFLDYLRSRDGNDGELRFGRRAGREMAA